MATARTKYEVSCKGKEQKSIIAAELDKENTPPNFGEAPDGGLRAWLVVTGSAFIFFSALGYAYSFGVFQEYYLTHQVREESPDNIAWIGSLSLFLQFAAGAIGGPLFDRFGAWVCLLAPLMFEPVH